MAIVEFKGFVNGHVGSPVFVLKVAESHRKKDGNGGYENAGKTFFQVKSGYEKNIDLASFPENAQVLVKGRQKTVKREYQGKDYYDLVVDADSIELVQPSQRPNSGFNGGSQAPGMSEWGSPSSGGTAPSGFGGGFDDEQPF